MIRLTLRNIAAHKLRLLMSATAVVLGIAFLSGVLVFNSGIRSTFDNIISGSTPDGVVRPVGANSFDSGEGGASAATIKASDVAKLQALPEVAAAAGRVDGLGMFLLDSKGKLVGGQGAPTFGLNHTETQNMLGEPILKLEEGRWPRASNEVTIDLGSAERAGYSIGQEVSLISPVGNPRRTATMVGTANFASGSTAGATLLVFSTEGAQKIFLGGRDVFTTVYLTAAPGVSQAELASAAKQVTPKGFTAVTGDKVAEQSKSAVGGFLDVISTFLLVFAVIAIVVGAFIIVNTFSILVAQRIKELALVRALGAGRGQVAGSVLLEAFVMSLVASGVGLLVGWGLALGLATLFSGLGLEIATGALTLSLSTTLICFAVGILVTMLSAFVPAWRATRVPPVAAMRDDAFAKPHSLRRRTVIGVVFLAIGAGLAWLGTTGAPGNDAAWIGVGAFIWIITTAAISPVLGRPVLVVCRAVFGKIFGTPGRLAGDNALRDPRRTGATASALMIGLALVSTISVLAASANKSIQNIVDDGFASDFRIQSATGQPFPNAIGDQVERTNGVAAVAREQVVRATIDGDVEFVSGTNRDYARVYKLPMDSGTAQTRGDQATVGAVTAKNLGVNLGDTLPIKFPSGRTVKVRVVGVVSSESSLGGGGITVPNSVFVKAGLQPRDSAISINVDPGANKSEVKRALDNIVADLPIVSVQDKEQFSESIRGQIDQILFLIFGLLALAILIAVIGIVNTLGLSVMERTREIGLLRAIGLSRPKLRRMITLESVVIALLGAVLGMTLGLVFGSLLRYALRDNLTALAIPVEQLLWFGVITVVVGVLAAVVPAIRAARMNVLDAISTE